MSMSVSFKLNCCYCFVGLIERDVERIVMHNQKVLYAPEEWEEPTAFNKYYDETVIDEFMYGRRKRH